MSFEIPTKDWSHSVSTVTLGATPDDGGTRTSTVTIGGSTTLPFLDFEGETGQPAMAMEVLDVEPDGWPKPLVEPFGDVLGDPADWAAKCVEDFGADLICLKLESAEPTRQDASPDECAETVRSILAAVGVPLIIWGCGDYDKDNEVMPVCSQAAAGERCLLGSAEEDNYRTIAAAALADGHLVIGEAPLDISIQKQVNILLSEQGVPDDRIVMYQVTGAVGYGVEYAYSILERTRIAALGGDRMLGMPMLSIVGSEAWKTKEAWMTEAENPEWGPIERRGIIWEVATAELFLLSGTDMLIFWHPEAMDQTRWLVEEMSSNPAGNVVEAAVASE
ncbi:MAG: CO dehydrogenase/acetyl-CoA synthase subunit delta [Armatimonadota bacterium]